MSTGCAGCCVVLVVLDFGGQERVAVPVVEGCRGRARGGRAGGERLKGEGASDDRRYGDAGGGTPAAAEGDAACQRREA